MNLAKLEQKIITVARANPPSDRVPVAFERRVMARLAQRPALDLTAFWAWALWRAAAASVAVVMLLGVGTVLFTPASHSGELAQQLESTVLAAVDPVSAN
jgi:hypothetical protein